VGILSFNIRRAEIYLVVIGHEGGKNHYSIMSASVCKSGLFVKKEQLHSPELKKEGFK
jgi:hypothetical protein